MRLALFDALAPTHSLLVIWVSVILHLLHLADLTGLLLQTAVA